MMRVRPLKHLASIGTLAPEEQGVDGTENSQPGPLARPGRGWLRSGRVWGRELSVSP